MNLKDINTFAEILNVFKKRSTCAKRQVSAIIVKNGRIISTGWNGVPSGFKHCNSIFKSSEFGNDTEEHKLNMIKHKEYQMKYEIHAEANAICFAAKNGTNVAGSDIYTIFSPCYDCSKMIVASGIKRVFYVEVYDYDPDAIEFLNKCGVECININFTIKEI